MIFDGEHKLSKISLEAFFLPNMKRAFKALISIYIRVQV